ncbi:hypothetical protein [Microlunatus speluncae]|uniref:hypothetical protein n=1 Tax=Microlunatus speluncae TaxID=2594267 RepID=UPI001266343F|nr:hypothetical protein [Microlunatus speluncae]
MTQLRRQLQFLIGTFVWLRSPAARDERGLSQSAENAILLAGAVAVATIVITTISIYVSNHLPK